MNPADPNPPAGGPPQGAGGAPEAQPQESQQPQQAGGGLRFGAMSAQQYWRRNIACVLILLTVWFLVSYGCGILWANKLDAVRTPGGGIKLGFWFAQQGSIYVFVLLIGFYVWFMNRLDAKFTGRKS